MAFLGHESRVASHETPPPTTLILALQRQQRTTLPGDTPFYAAPNGTLLGTLRSGASVVFGRARGAWRQVTFEGWIFTSSTGPSPRQEFTLSVRADGGENLRNRPDGDRIARAVEGTGFTRLARQGGWTRVRRTAWIHRGGESPANRGSRVAGGDSGRAARVESRDSSPAPLPPPAVLLAQEPAADRVIIRKGATLSVGPGGAGLGPVPEDMPGEVSGRAGNWVRVRTETWVRAEDLRPAPQEGAVTLERLRTEQDKLVGQSVTWRLQFLAVQRADELRPELPAGQPYLLTRGPLPEVGFVYVAVSADQMPRFRSMSPLDEFVARGRIRASRTRHLPTPVIELDR
ncbi:MAG TPA: hypothetical protein VGA78_18900, partial [Gemmatimonadales bacterium]